MATSAQVTTVTLHINQAVQACLNPVIVVHDLWLAVAPQLPHRRCINRTCTRVVDQEPQTLTRATSPNPHSPPHTRAIVDHQVCHTSTSRTIWPQTSQPQAHLVAAMLALRNGYRRG